MITSKVIGLVMVALIALTLVALPSYIAVAADQGGTAPQHRGRPWWSHVNVTVNQTIELAYLVRNETYPVFMFAIQDNITAANKTLMRADYFLELAINTSSGNESLAKAYALVATVLYSHGPVFAYPVLGKTIRNNLGENHTVTNETVEAALAKTLKLKNIVLGAINTAEEANITIPARVNILLAVADGYINATQELLSKGYYRAALVTTIKAYHRLVLAYGFTVKATIAQKLGLGSPQGLTARLGLRKASIKVMERIIEHLPAPVRTKLIQKIRRGEIRTPEQLRSEIREIMKYYYKRMANISIETTARIVTKTIIVAAMMPVVPFQQRMAIRQWLMQKELWHNWRALYNYVRGIVEAKHQETNATGLVLVNVTLSAISADITQTTGVQVDLVQIFHVYLVVHWAFHHGHRR